MSAGARSVLLLLASGPPLTLSEIAGKRAVSRQFIQRLAAGMIAKGWLTAEVNPRHKRSSKMCLTAKGEAVAAAIGEREAPIASAISNALRNQDVEAARKTLEVLNQAIEAQVASLKEFD